jgi:hypothetical protein
MYSHGRPHRGEPLVLSVWWGWEGVQETLEEELKERAGTGVRGTS